MDKSRRSGVRSPAERRQESVVPARFQRVGSMARGGSEAWCFLGSSWEMVALWGEGWWCTSRICGLCLHISGRRVCIHHISRVECYNFVRRECQREKKDLPASFAPGCCLWLELPHTVSLLPERGISHHDYFLFTRWTLDKLR